MSPFQQTVYRNLVRHAAGTAIHCPHCQEILDAPTTVLLSDGERATRVSCAKCYGKPAGSFTAGSVEILDGRTLFGRPSKLLWRFK